MKTPSIMLNQPFGPFHLPLSQFLDLGPKHGPKPHSKAQRFRMQIPLAEASQT